VQVIQALNFPKASLRLEKYADQLFVWCIVRRKKLVLTPEEWVRQHVIHYFVFSVGIPLERIVSEYAFEVNGLLRRCDLLVLDIQGTPKMVVECKATKIQIDESVLFQIAHYNRQLRATYLMLTNGHEHLLTKINEQTGNLEPQKEVLLEWFY